MAATVDVGGSKTCDWRTGRQADRSAALSSALYTGRAVTESEQLDLG